MTPETKYVTVSSSDTSSDLNRLEIDADVKPKPDTGLDISYSPYMLEFGLNKGKLEEMIVQFRNRGSQELKLQVIDYPRSLFQAKLSTETLAPAKNAELKVKPAKGFPEGIVRKSLTLMVTGQKEFRITIPLKREKGSGSSLPPAKVGSK